MTSKTNKKKKRTGKIIRISKVLQDHLDEQKGDVSYDHFLRSAFNLTHRKYQAQLRRRQMWLLPTSMTLHKVKSEAFKLGVLNAYERGDTVPEEPVKVTWWE